MLEKIKETIHSIKDKNHINSISYNLPEIWIPNLNLNQDKLTPNTSGQLLFLNIVYYIQNYIKVNIINTVYPNTNISHDKNLPIMSVNWYY